MAQRNVIKPNRREFLFRHGSSECSSPVGSRVCATISAGLPEMPGSALERAQLSCVLKGRGRTVKNRCPKCAGNRVLKSLEKLVRLVKRERM